MTSCILDERKKNGCAGCDFLCQHKIAMEGFAGSNGGRIGAAGAPSDYRNLTLATSPARVGMEREYDLFEKYVETFKRGVNGERIKSLYLWGTVGNGKTTSAVSLLNEYVMTSYLTSLKANKQPPQVPALFLDMAELQNNYNLASMTNSDEDMLEVKALLQKASKVPFLVMDDIAVRDSSVPFRSLLHGVINARTTNNLPTVYTSNIPLEDFVKVYDARLYDRVRDQCVEIHYGGKSNRGRR